MTIQPYPAYQVSQSQLLQSVPAHWSIRQIKHFARLAYGDSLPSEQRDESGIIRVFGSNGEVGTHGSANTDGPVIVIGRKGSFGALKWSNDAVFAIDTAFFIDRHYANCNLRWLYWALHVANLSAFSQDTGVPGLARELVHGLDFVLPSDREQAAIAAFLDRETGKIDALVADQERLIALLKEKRQAVISRAVTKGLNPSAPMKNSGVEWLGEVPAHWQVLSLTRLVERFVDYRGATPTKVSEGIPLITATAIRHGRVDHQRDPVFITEAEYAERMTRGFPKKGDLLLTTEAPLGEAALVDDEKIAPGQRMILMKLNARYASGDYLLTHFK